MYIHRLWPGFLLILLATVFSKPVSAQKPVAVKGVIDLTQFSVSDGFTLELNGEWEFYWNSFLRPSDFKKEEKPSPDIYGKVPSYWTEYRKQIPTAKYGYATYRLVVLLPEKVSACGFYIPVFDSSFELWVDDTLFYSNGRPGTTENTTIPLYRPGLRKYVPRSDTLTITINVANFHHRRGGFWLPLMFGSFDEINKIFATRYIGTYVTISILAGFSLFFLIFFLMYPRDKVMLFFSGALLSLALRPFFNAGYIIYDFIKLDWTWTVRMEYIFSFLAVISWAWYNLFTFPLKINRYAAWFLTIMLGTICLLVMITPVKTFSYGVFLLYSGLLIMLILSFYSSVSGYLKRKRTDGFYVALFFFLFLGIIHDMFVSLGKTKSSVGYTLPLVIVIFIFFHSVLIIYKWVQDFKEKERLRINLEDLNKNLESIVAARTSELQLRNNEIEAKNSMIEKQNIRLTETINLKNRLFSVIAHDLRSPVVSILYILNLLKEKENRENYEKFAESSISYAQATINLLENMLVWGRSQEDKIRYSPGMHDLASIILTNMSIFKEPADRKNISINLTQKGRPDAFFDKDLIDIVIRNLISNALKYTPNGGRISILLKEDVAMKKSTVSVCDNGIGMTDETIRAIFSAGEVRSTPGTENEKGTGIGLKLCLDLVRLNKGVLTIESRPGEGSCIQIVLPSEAI